MDETLLPLSKKYDLDVKNNVNPLPSFVMAKIIHKSCISMLKELSNLKKQKEEKRVKLLADIKQAETSIGIGLEDARNANAHTPPKTSTRSTNLASRENATNM